MCMLFVCVCIVTVKETKTMMFREETECVLILPARTESQETKTRCKPRMTMISTRNLDILCSRPHCSIYKCCETSSID